MKTSAVAGGAAIGRALAHHAPHRGIVADASCRCAAPIQESVELPSRRITKLQ